VAVTLPAQDYNTEFEPGSINAAVKSGEYKESRGTATLLMVPPDKIHIADGFNVRTLGTAEYQAGIEALANSIEVEGFYRHKPITGAATKMEDGSQGITVTDGHRRMAAVNLLRETGRPVPELIPVLLEPPGTSMIDRTVALAKTGKELLPIELATICKRLQGLGLDDKEIAKRLDITPRYLSNMYLLLSAPRKVLGMVAAGKVSATTAIEELRAKGTGATESLAAAVETAEKKGKTKATRKDVAPPPADAPAPSGWTSDTFKFKAKRGDSVDVDTIRLFKAVFGGLWWDTTGEENVVEITEDISITIVAKRRVTASVPDAPPAAEPEEDDL
jgi:ParB family chromosome partitioning protein